VFDLNNIGELENFLNNILKSSTNSGGSETSIDISTEFSHIRFKRDDLITMVKLSASIINLKSTQVVPKSITIVYNEDGYKMVANNDLEYLEYKFEVLNKENRLTDTISLPIDIINSVIKMTDNEIMIYKKEDSYYIRLLLEGDLYLELPKPEAALLTKPTTGLEPLKFKEEDPGNIVSPQYLLEALKAFIPIVEEEPILDRRRITFNKDRMYFSSMKYFLDYRLPLPKIKISLRFAEVVKRLISSYNISEGIRFYQDKNTDSRIALEYGNVFFTSTITKVPCETKLVEYLDRVRSHKQFLVNIKDLERVVNIAYALPYSRKEVKIKFNSEDLVVTVPMKTRVTEFKIQCKKLEDISISNELVLSAKSLKKLIECFSSDDVVLSILDTSLVLSKGNLTGVLGS
jgi:hypothetical protein